MFLAPTKCHQRISLDKTASISAASDFSVAATNYIGVCVLVFAWCLFRFNSVLVVFFFLFYWSRSDQSFFVVIQDSSQEFFFHFAFYPILAIPPVPLLPPPSSNFVESVFTLTGLRD